MIRVFMEGLARAAPPGRGANGGNESVARP